jgi:uncharacterized protein (DUF433 family)
MSRIHWQNFIIIDPEIHYGEPCIKGTHVPVAILVGSIPDGMTIDEVIKEYPRCTVLRGRYGSTGYSSSVGGMIVYHARI